MDWKSKAKCRDTDPDIFFPVVRSNGRPKAGAPEDEKRGRELAEWEVAQQICRGGDGGGECPVRKECLQWAMDTRQVDGVLGGMTSEGRRSLRRRLGRGTRTRVA